MSEIAAAPEYAFILTELDLPYFWWRYIGNARRTVRAWRARCSDSDVPLIAREFAEQGIVVGPSDRFLTTEGRTALSRASELTLNISRTSNVQETVARGVSDGSKSYMMHLIHFAQEHSIDSPLVKLALDRKLLEIVSSYLGLWPRLYSISALLNFPTAGEAEKAQLWHRDREDLKIVKVFIYLVGVDENCGPFSYIPATHQNRADLAMGPKRNDKNITDDEMRMKFPSETWRICTGPTHTMILADTVGYHRGGKPLKGNRILITFTYTSGTPLKSKCPRVLGRPSWHMDEIQREALGR